MGKESLYPEQYHLKKDFCCKNYTGLCCCYKRKDKAKHDQKCRNLKACKMIIQEKLDLGNFLHDAMDFHAVRQLMIKSRHKILMPTLVLQLTKTKVKKGGRGYKTSFARNIHERTDQPVFTTEDAVSQLKKFDNTRTEVEKAMDEFFLSHLPEDVMQNISDAGGNELDE